MYRCCEKEVPKQGKKWVKNIGRLCIGCLQTNTIVFCMRLILRCKFELGVNEEWL
jgi:hypothetical protein